MAIKHKTFSTIDERKTLDSLGLPWEVDRVRTESVALTGC